MAQDSVSEFTATYKRFAPIYVTASTPHRYQADCGNRRNIIALVLAALSGVTAVCRPGDSPRPVTEQPLIRACSHASH